MTLVSDDSQRLSALATALDHLARETAAPWLEHGLREGAGAHGFLDRRFRPVVDSAGAALGPSGEVRGDQSLVQQSRHLFSYSLLHERWGESDPRAGAAALHMYRHLKSSFFQGKGRPFTHQLTPQLEPRDESVQLYAQGFAAYALATYSLAFGDGEAAEMALDLFYVVDTLRHDPVAGGYDQRNDGGWLAYVDAPEGAAKCTNTHIHMLEALTPLAVLYPQDSRVTGRLAELAEAIAAKLQQPAGYVHKHFALDWTPVGRPECSYGHDLETSWLLLDALASLRRAASLDPALEQSVMESAKRMAEHALRTGWDERGGVFDFGRPEGEAQPAEVVGREKVWWAQLEALPGLLHLYFQTRDVPLLGKMEETLRFVSEVSWDQEGGEFPWGVMSDGSLGPRGDHKGEIWKTPYHALRACLITADWIRQDLTLQSTSVPPSVLPSPPRTQS